MKKLIVLILCLLLSGCAARLVKQPALVQEEPEVMELPQTQAVSSPQVTMQLPETQEFVPDIPVFSSEKIPDEIKQMMKGVSHTEQSPLDWEDLRYLTITYIDFEGEKQTGYMIVHRELAGEVLEIFSELYVAGFPIARMELIEAYDGNDSKSMEANNSYAYCTRLIAGTQVFSNHSYGAAIDINPAQNPYILGTQALPAQSADYLDRAESRPGMIIEGDICYNAFVSRGWEWGGQWPNPDFQHFEKTVF